MFRRGKLIIITVTDAHGVDANSVGANSAQRHGLITVQVVRTVAAPPSIVVKCGFSVGGWFFVWSFVVLFLSCRVLCCSCCVFVCVTCFSSYKIYPSP